MEEKINVFAWNCLDWKNINDNKAVKASIVKKNLKHLNSLFNQKSKRWVWNNERRVWVEAERPNGSVTLDFDYSFSLIKEIRDKDAWMLINIEEPMFKKIELLDW